MKRLPYRHSIILAIAAAAVFGNGAVAYVGQNPYAVRLDGPAGVVACSAQVVITATVRDAKTAAPVGGQVVNWDFKVSLSPDDRLSPRSTITGDDGRTSVSLKFGAANGRRTVRATIATFPATVDFTCSGALSTSAPTSTPVQSVEPTVAPSAATSEPTTSATGGPASTPTADTTSESPPTGAPTAPSESPVTPPSPTGVSPVPSASPRGSASGQGSSADMTLVVVALLLAAGVGGLVLLFRVRR